MTLIVAVSDHTGTWLAGDSRVSGEESVIGSVDKLIQYSPDLAIGFAGNVRDLNIVRQFFKPPKVNKTIDPEKYLITKFVPSLYKILDKQGRLCPFEEEGGTDKWNGEMLVIVRDNIFRMMNDFAIIRQEDEAALGQAEDFAKAMLIFGRLVGIEGDERCKTAIEQASKSFFGCDNNIKMLKIR